MAKAEQALDMWTGTISSNWTIQRAGDQAEAAAVSVVTAVDPLALAAPPHKAGAAAHNVPPLSAWMSAQLCRWLHAHTRRGARG